MITLWTVYDQPMTFSWLARRSVVAAPDELVEAGDAGEHVKLSSDLEALRGQFRRMGLECYGRDPFDAPEIIEVWLGRRKSDGGRQDLSRPGQAGTDPLP
jgi:hypothetical protein